ncbi:MAG: hypothetical protein ACRCWG_00885 [Sarcina sp.]
MIKRLLTLGIISGILVAGGFAISRNMNHDPSKYQPLLAKPTQNKTYEFSALNGSTNLADSEDLWTYGLSPNGGSAVSIVYPKRCPWDQYVGFVISGVVNGNGQSSYSPLELNVPADASVPNVAGPNTYEAGSQGFVGNSQNYMQWYNEFNNSGPVQTESRYPMSSYN